MGNQTSKIKVIIASHHSLIANGIKAFINLYSSGVEYLVFESMEYTLMNQNKPEYYLFLHHRLLQFPKTESLLKLTASFEGKIMILANEKMEKESYSHIIFPGDSDETVMEKLDDFFVSQTVIDESDHSDVLSAREIDILKEVALGYSNKEIADRLFISINTVITHRKNITEKLGIKTIAGLTVYALMNNLINPNDVTI